MKCDHCCYSCAPGKGKHMDYNTVLAALDFISNWDEMISIGGGEPTLHPRFFDILQKCLQRFDYVWFATNGSRTKTMWRLIDILDGCDYENFEDDYIELKSEYQLTVALSVDHYHDYNKVDYRIRDIWKRRSGNKTPGFELRDVVNSHSGVINAGRASRTGVYQCEKECVCSSIFIQPDGLIKACGCKKSPIIGNIWDGYSKYGKQILEDEGFHNTGCYRGIGTE